MIAPPALVLRGEFQRFGKVTIRGLLFSGMEKGIRSSEGLDEMSLSEVAIGPVRLRTLPQDADWYRQRRQFEEMASGLYRLLAQERFRNFIDVGANSGMVSVFARLAAPDLRIVAIEADQRLVEIIPGNFTLNGLKEPELIHSIASAKTDGNGLFSLNPKSTLDNRVAMDGWAKVSVPQIALDDLFKDRRIEGKTFLKIDTQGHEKHVLEGFANTMRSRSDWIIKMEFAPMWLKSQGTDPAELVRSLSSHYLVAEYPERITYNHPALSTLLSHPISPDQAEHFASYVESLDRNARGWVDLVVAPRSWRPKGLRNGLRALFS